MNYLSPRDTFYVWKYFQVTNRQIIFLCSVDFSSNKAIRIHHSLWQKLKKNNKLDCYCWVYYCFYVHNFISCKFILKYWCQYYFCMSHELSYITALYPTSIPRRMNEWTKAEQSEREKESKREMKIIYIRITGIFNGSW